jgi:hypothetical protein
MSFMKTLARPRDKAEVLGRLRRLRPESGRRWGRMSAHRMVCHLADSFRIVVAGRPVSEASGPLRWAVVRWIALDLPLRWPSGIPTRPEIDPEREGTRPDDFTGDVARLEDLLEQFTAPTRQLDGRSHPTFGRLSDAAWLRWGYRHMDHHLRQFGV